MKNRYFKVLLIILCCFIISGCSNIKAIRNKQLKKDEVIKLVEEDLNSKYNDLNIELISVDKAYTAENNLIKNAKNYKGNKNSKKTSKSSFQKRKHIGLQQYRILFHPIKLLQSNVRF